MNDEELEDLMYRAGLTAQGCWDSMDQYDRAAIMDFAKRVAAEKDKEIKRLQDLLYTQLGELTALRAEKQMRGHIKELQEQPR